MYAIPIDEFPKTVTEVTLISTPTCTSCPSIRRFFESRDIEYTEVHLDEADDELKTQIAALNIKTAPVLVCDGLIVAAGGVQRLILSKIEAGYNQVGAAA